MTVILCVVDCHQQQTGLFDDYNDALQEALTSLQKAFEEAVEACFEG